MSRMNGKKTQHTHTVGGLNLHLDNTAVQKILSDRMLGIKGSADHSRWTCVDSTAQKMPSETTTACVRLLVFFRIRHGTFPYGVEDDTSTITQTPTTHYTNTCVKLTIVTHLSFSERTAIANLSLIVSPQAGRTKLLSYSTV